MNSVVRECENLTEEDLALLERLAGDLGILADLSRADVLVYCLCLPQRAVAVAQARPHSILPIHDESLVGVQVTPGERLAVFHTLNEGRRASTELSRTMGEKKTPGQAAPIVQETYPFRSSDGRVIAALCIETNLIERERHRRRSRVFRRALKLFLVAVLSGLVEKSGPLAPFAEHDGVMVVDAQHRIQYVSGIATSLYRNLGYAGNLIKRHVEDLELDDHEIVVRALEDGRCYQAEMQVGDLVWVKKAMPFFSTGKGLLGLMGGTHGSPKPEGVLVTIHDETDARRREKEREVRAAMIQEIHHRVKNNMQTIASLLRLQFRRAEMEETRRALQEGINRILSMAVIHEFLAHQEARVINIRDVSQRIINQIREGVVDREQGIRLGLEGPNIYLPTQPATVCALVINELLLNALEHGYERQDGGTVTVRLKDDGELITIAVDDDGVGLPEEFDLAQTSSLGLHIVRTLAQDDLRGDFKLKSRDKGVSAIVTFPKQTQGGR